MLQFVDVTLHRGERLLFDRLNATIYASHKVGVVGRNGIGKSTLFHLVRGRLRPEEGEVRRPQAWRLASLDQDVEPSPRGALDFVLDGDARLRGVERAIETAQQRGDDEALGTLYADFEDAGGYHAHARGGEILSGLGFVADDFQKPHRAFSGGWRIRLNLARALMTPSDLLLLDEPTNHLDLEATLWLESWLRKYQGTLAMIAHDRDFLDRTTEEIIHLDRGQANLYQGNYSAFERQRAEALTRQAALHKSQQQRVTEIRRFVDRFRAKASKAKQVQSRLKALEKMDLAAPIHAESPYRFKFAQPKKISNPILSLDAATLGYGNAKVLQDATLRVYPNDRIGVLGVNGAGKTTLLRSLAGELQPLVGRFTRGRHSAVGYFAQHQLEALNLDASPLAHADELGLSSQQALDYLGGWGFDGDDVRRPAYTFSGGEKARLVLAIIAFGNPAVLVLDEPTNHLDLQMREALAIALQSYGGALLLVSHDRHLLRRCVDRFWLVADGAVQPYQADLDDYLALPAAKRERQAAPRAQRKPHAAAKRLGAKQHQLEARIDTLAEQAAELDRRLADDAANGRRQTIEALAKERRQVGDAMQRCEQEWLAVQEELDRVEQLGGSPPTRRERRRVEPA